MVTVDDVSRIEGPNLTLRLITPDDAEYVFGLRTDQQYNSYLSPVNGDVGSQRAWIEAYKMREGELGEL
ncbi:MAG: N-acetyltransferase, partial [Pseudomonadota bacterium]